MQRSKSEGDVGKRENRCDRGRGESGEEEEEEEEKMEQFFAILRNYKEARNRMRELEQDREAEESRRKRRRLAEPDGTERCSGWVPRFEPEDFSADVEFRSRPPLSLPLPLPLPRSHPPRPPPATAKAPEREGKARDDGLELKLTI